MYILLVAADGCTCTRKGILNPLLIKKRYCWFGSHSHYNHASALQAKQEEESKKKSSIIACPIHNFFAIKYGGRKQTYRRAVELKLKLNPNS